MKQSLQWINCFCCSPNIDMVIITVYLSYWFVCLVYSRWLLLPLLSEWPFFFFFSFPKSPERLYEEVLELGASKCPPQLLQNFFIIILLLSEACLASTPSCTPYLTKQSHFPYISDLFQNFGLLFYMLSKYQEVHGRINKTLRWKTGMEFCKTMSIPSLFYSSEVWVPNINISSRIQSADDFPER